MLTFLSLSEVCALRMSLLSPILVLGPRVSPVRQKVLVLGCYISQSVLTESENVASIQVLSALFKFKHHINSRLNIKLLGHHNFACFPANLHFLMNF